MSHGDENIGQAQTKLHSSNELFSSSMLACYVLQTMEVLDRWFAICPMSEQHGQHHETFRSATSLHNHRDCNTPTGQAPLLLLTPCKLRHSINCHLHHIGSAAHHYSAYLIRKHDQHNCHQRKRDIEGSTFYGTANRAIEERYGTSLHAHSPNTRPLGLCLEVSCIGRGPCADSPCYACAARSSADCVRSDMPTADRGHTFHKEQEAW